MNSNSYYSEEDEDSIFEPLEPFYGYSSGQTPIRLYTPFPPTSLYDSEIDYEDIVRDSVSLVDFRDVLGGPNNDYISGLDILREDHSFDYPTPIFFDYSKLDIDDEYQM